MNNDRQNVIFPKGENVNPDYFVLLVTDGQGFYQEKGQPARILAKGDVVVITSTIEHWHGASKDSGMIHIAVTNNSPEGPVKWLAPVTEEEYESVH